MTRLALLFVAAAGIVAGIYFFPFFTAQGRLQREAEEAVRARLKDPGSAEFSGWIFNDHNGDIACGEVNAKNSYGGYTGAQKFIYTRGMSPEVVLADDILRDVFETLWSICR